MPGYRLSIKKQQLQKREMVDGGVDLLTALRTLGLPMRQACRNGVCGLCRCRLLDGSVSYRQRDPYALDGQDRAAGYILPCIAFATSDLAVELPGQAEGI